MAILKDYREYVIEAIVAILLEDDDFEQIVEDAIGKSPYALTGRQQSRKNQISQILAKLEGDGTKSWLLINVLVRAAADNWLRQLIVKACPNTLASSPSVEDKVRALLLYLKEVVGQPLPPKLRLELWEKRQILKDTIKKINELIDFKILHEYLHVLLQNLIVDSILSIFENHGNSNLDLEDSPSHIEEACSDARRAIKQLPEAARSFLEELERSANQIRTNLASGDTAAAAEVLYNVRRLLRIELPRLNECVFDAARRFPLPGLLLKPPVELLGKEAFPLFEYAVRDLKPSVLVRALEHTIWQGVDSEVSLLTDLFAVSTGWKAVFVEHWFPLKARLEWLATLDPEGSWSRDIFACAENIDDELAHENKEDVAPLFEIFSRLVKFHFLKVDARLKSHWKSLDRIGPELSKILTEIGND